MENIKNTNSAITTSYMAKKGITKKHNNMKINKVNKNF